MTETTKTEAAKSNGRAARGVRVARHYTAAGEFDPRRAFPPGEFDVGVPGSGFEQKGVVAPKAWGQQAVTVAAKHYFRRAGALTRSGREESVYDLVGRVAWAIRDAGDRGGYFASKADKHAFCDELTYLLLGQVGAFNTPVWINVGLAEAYDAKGPGGNWAWFADEGLGSGPQATLDSYTRPQASACFIQSVGDDLESIGELVKSEMRLFKHGSGTGSNFSNLRGAGEPLSSGGSSSGLISFLRVLDEAAGSIKSGGTTRRAAKMVCLDADHPDVEAFVAWKVDEEKKARALVAAGYSPGMDGEAYTTVSGQNANNSIRVTDEFMRKATEPVADRSWALRRRTDGRVAKTVHAADLFASIASAAWEVACPGLQFDTTINRWHTVPAAGRINASNPCSEYMHLDDSACNLASLNLVKFLRDDGSFDVEAFRHAVGIFIMAQEILVDYASYPTAKICQNSHDFRPLGLGYCNLGAALMRLGLPYDSDEGRHWAAAVTSLLGGEATRASAMVAEQMGPFPGYGPNRDAMLGVVAMHVDAASDYSTYRAGADVARAGHLAWTQAYEAGRRFGFRNAQVTNLAPTGTIGLLMGADTLGIEPCLALVAEKALAGGGSLRIVNESVGPALLRLGYSGPSVDSVLEYVREHGTVEGSGVVRDEHLPVFDTAFGVGGRFIRPEGHVDMMAHTQPFLSGAISKTVNLPADATVEDVAAVYVRAWKKGLKAIAIYRDGSKGAQPVKAVGAAKAEAPTPEPFAPAATEGELAAIAFRQGLEKGRAEGALKALAYARGELSPGPGGGWGVKKKLPGRRAGGFTQAARVGGHKLFVRTGEYEGGAPAELFIDLANEGAPMRSWANALAMAVSIGLQHGTPLDEYVDKFEGFGFEPRGIVEGDDRIKMAPSVVAYVFRLLGVEYLGRDDLAQVPAAGAGDEGAAPENVVWLAPASTAPSPAPASPSPPAAAPRGKVGAPCASCGSTNTRPSGSCVVCAECGATSGCS